MASLAQAEITEIRQAPVSLASSATVPMIIGLGCLAFAAAVGFGSDNLSRFWHAYLLGTVFCTSLALGGLFFVLAHHLTGGRWGTPVRRLAELAAGALTTSAVMFIPILVWVLSGGTELYPWVDRAMVAADPILRGKSGYLDPQWFAIRTVLYFALWIWMSQSMLRSSVKQDSSDPLTRARNMQWRSGPMILIFALTMNFAAFDWLMSLEPHWFSTMFGVYFFAGSFEGFLALLIITANRLQDRGVLSQSITEEQYHDIGKLMFAFIFFWGYIAFSQFMLIWYAAIPEETLWFDIRQQGPWVTWSLILLFGHLLIPFLGTMSRAVRRNRRLIGFWAMWMFVMHWVDLVYIICPQVDGPAVVPLPWLELVATVGMLGVFYATVLRSASGKWLLPVQDPRLPIALSYHNH